MVKRISNRELSLQHQTENGAWFWIRRGAGHGQRSLHSSDTGKMRTPSVRAPEPILVEAGVFTCGGDRKLGS